MLQLVESSRPHSCRNLGQQNNLMFKPLSKKGYFKPSEIRLTENILQLSKNAECKVVPLTGDTQLLLLRGKESKLLFWRYFQITLILHHLLSTPCAHTNSVLLFYKSHLAFFFYALINVMQFIIVLFHSVLNDFCLLSK